MPRGEHRDSRNGNPEPQGASGASDAPISAASIDARRGGVRWPQGVAMLAAAFGSTGVLMLAVPCPCVGAALLAPVAPDPPHMRECTESAGRDHQKTECGVDAERAAVGQRQHDRDRADRDEEGVEHQLLEERLRRSDDGGRQLAVRVRRWLHVVRK